MKHPSDTDTETAYLVLPPNANPLGNAFGGWLMAQMDLTAGICAKRYCLTPCVTVCVDDLQFNKPIKVGEVVIIKSRINYVGDTSMEVGIKVFKEGMSGVRTHCLTGYYTFVAIDDKGCPISVPRIKPKTDEEKKRWSEAKRRKTDRLARKR